MRLTLFAFIGLWFWTLQAPAQSAVLIGVRFHESDSHPSIYRTYLITLRGGKVRLAADLPDLIVPRKEGFWRVGTLD